MADTVKTRPEKPDDDTIKTRPGKPDADTAKTRAEKPDEDKYKKEHAEAEKVWKISQEKYVSLGSFQFGGPSQQG